METTQAKTTNGYLLPAAILVAGLLISGAVLYTAQNTAPTNYEPEPLAQEEEEPRNLDALRSLSEQDHVRGGRDAQVTIFEYSDFECPFCKQFHDTMNSLMSKYEGTNKLAWVYRHFPLESLHPIKAEKEAIASECAAAQGGDDAFWKFADAFFELTPSNNQTDIDTVFPQIAEAIGLDVAAFTTCVNNDTYKDRVQADVENATATGGNGTPWSILVGPDGTKYPINGALPQAAIEELIETALKAS